VAPQSSSLLKAHSSAKQTRVEGDQRLTDAALNIIPPLIVTVWPAVLLFGVVRTRAVAITRHNIRHSPSPARRSPVGTRGSTRQPPYNGSCGKRLANQLDDSLKWRLHLGARLADFLTLGVEVLAPRQRYATSRFPINLQVDGHHALVDGVSAPDGSGCVGDGCPRRR
jgi:hypothetical protein